MTRNVHDALASHFDRYAVRREIHHELPHTTYEVTVDGRRAVCKVASGERADVGAEAAVSDHVDRHTDVPVPAILAADETAFVAAWADGLPDAEAGPSPEEITESHARAMGETMAHLHAETADQFARPGFPRFDPDGESTTTPARGRYLTVDDRADWDAVARAFLRDHRDYLADLGWADPADRVLDLLDDRPGLFDGAGTPVLCHGNVYPEHVGFEDTESGDSDRGSVDAVIDFEHALVAPAEYDFWRTALPLFYDSELEPRPQFAAFRAGYESVRSLPLGVERRREAWWLVNTVTYFTSLALENDGIGEDERDQAEAMADWIAETVAALRERRS